MQKLVEILIEYSKVMFSIYLFKSEPKFIILRNYNRMQGTMIIFLNLY